MEVNADFSELASVRARSLSWQPSPMPGVDRKMLDRIGGEVARATSIVRYAPGSSFSEHTHSGGEEFIVLEGVFQDEHADYPAGSYVRNPIGTHHVPRSDDGCTIFVKLWQFDEHDASQFSLDINTLVPKDHGDGTASCELHRFGTEIVSFEEWDAGASVDLRDERGVELLVLAGSLSLAGETLEKHDWLRLPASRSAGVIAGSDGAQLWIKRGHLGVINVPDQG